MFVNPGNLDKKITIFSISDGKDADGFRDGNRETVRRCWAQFRRTTGSEKMASGTDIADERSRFLVRTTEKKITAGMYIQYAGEVYDIIFVNDYNDDGQYTEIWAKKG